jgi:hypothetical protein
MNCEVCKAPFKAFFMIASKFEIQRNKIKIKTQADHGLQVLTSRDVSLDTFSKKTPERPTLLVYLEVIGMWIK